MSEDTSGQTGTATERDVARKVSGRATIVIVAVVIALALLMAFNMN